MSVSSARSLYRWASIASLLVAISFGSAIVLLNPAPVAAHEVAGLVLLILLSLALVGAFTSRTEDPRRVNRSGIALALLVIMASSGAAVGSGLLTGAFADLPLVLLVGLSIALMEMIRIAYIPVSPPVAVGQAPVP